MREYVGEAVVLSSDPNGDLDSRVALFTKEHGKLTAKAKSARKVTSKLAGHLQPGNVVRVRLVEKHGLQVADALKQSVLGVSPPDLFRLNALLGEAQPEQQLWELLVNGQWSWSKVLRVLGWDPAGAQCRGCGKASPSFFSPATQDFFCDACASKTRPGEVFSIGDSHTSH
jgi:recombinational DNA repair protein (RecF pathway)